MNKNSKLLLLIIGITVFCGGGVFASPTQGTIDSVKKYAWTNYGGWVNFGCDYCDVAITDSAITGYAWIEDFGWLKLDPSEGGVANDSTGILSGSAWGENTGWIDFSGVTINSLGEFTGTATGNIVGIINFECTATGCPVKTDWRPIGMRGGANAATIGTLSPPVVPSGGFSVSINNGEEVVNNPVVVLKMNAGEDIKNMAISESPNFENVGQEAFRPTKTFVLPAGDGLKTVYVKFYNQSGQTSPTVSASVVLKALATLPPINPTEDLPKQEQSTQQPTEKTQGPKNSSSQISSGVSSLIQNLENKIKSVVGGKKTTPTPSINNVPKEKPTVFNSIRKFFKSVFNFFKF